MCVDVGTTDDLSSNGGESNKCTPGPKCTPAPKPSPGPTKSTPVHSKCSPAFLDKVLDFNFDDRTLNVNDVFFDGDNGEDAGPDAYTLGWVQVVAKRCAKVYLSPVYGPSPPLVAKHIREMSDAAVKEVFKPDVSTRAGRTLNNLLGGRYCWQWSASLAGKAAALHRCKVRGLLVMMSYNVHGFPNGKRHSLTCHKYKDTYRAKWCRLGFGRSVFENTDVRHIVKRGNGEGYRSDCEEAADVGVNAVVVGADDECESEPVEYVGFYTDDESTFEEAACAAVTEVESMNSDSDSASSGCVPRSSRTTLATGSAESMNSDSDSGSSGCVPRSPRTTLATGSVESMNSDSDSASSACVPRSPRTTLATGSVEPMNSDSDSGSSGCVPRSPRTLTPGSALEYTPEKQTRRSQSYRRISSSRALFPCGEKRGNDNKDYGFARKRKRGNMMTPCFHSYENDDSNGHYREQQTEACNNDLPLLGCDKNVLRTFDDAHASPRKRKRDNAMTSCLHYERDHNGETCENEKTEYFEVHYLCFHILANFSNLSDFILLVIHHYVFRLICLIALT